MSEQLMEPTSESPTVFDTPQPVRLHVSVPSGRIEITADRVSQTSVLVLPRSSHRESDRKAAEQTRVFRNGDDIYVEVPEQARSLFRHGAIRLTVSLPERSSLTANIASTDMSTTGILGNSSIQAASGGVRIDTIGALFLKSASGDISIDRVTGDLEVSSASGDIRVREMDASVRVNSASGDLALGAVHGELRSTTTSGETTIRALDGSATCTTTSGDIEIERVGTGTVQTRTVSGDATIGVPAGTAAWLQVQSMSGGVNSRLDATDAPAEDERTVQIIANAVSGDVNVRRAA